MPAQILSSYVLSGTPGSQLVPLELVGAYGLQLEPGERALSMNGAVHGAGHHLVDLGGSDSCHASVGTFDLPGH